MTAVLRQGDSSPRGTVSEKASGLEQGHTHTDPSDHAETLFYVFDMLSQLTVLLRECEENSVANLLEAVCDAGPLGALGRSTPSA